MNILITGGAGFVGSNLAIAAKANFPNANVIALDNLKRRGSELNISRLNDNGVNFIHGDVRHISDFPESKIDWIIECSAEPSASAGLNGGIDYLYNTNLSGTFNCLEIARRNQSKIIFLSTSRVYPVPRLRELPLVDTATRLELTKGYAAQGITQEGINENFSLMGHRTLYGATKLASELLLTEYSEHFNLDIIINRCGVIAGPWQMGKIDQGIAVLWMSHHCFNKPLSYIGFGGSGHQVRDMLHIDDLSSLIISQLNTPEKFKGQIFNVGGGISNSASLCELTDMCVKISGNRIQIECESETRQGDIPWYITDSKKISHLADWRPAYDIQDILSHIYCWIQKNEAALRPILCPK